MPRVEEMSKSLKDKVERGKNANMNDNFLIHTAPAIAMGKKLTAVEGEEMGTTEKDEATTVETVEGGEVTTGEIVEGGVLVLVLVQVLALVLVVVLVPVLVLILVLVDALGGEVIKFEDDVETVEEEGEFKEVMETVEGGEVTTVIEKVEETVEGGEVTTVIGKVEETVQLEEVTTGEIVEGGALVLVDALGGEAAKVVVDPLQSVEEGNGDESDSWSSISESSINESSGRRKSDKVKNTKRKKKKRPKKKNEKITESELNEIIGLEDLQRATVTKHFVQQLLGADLNEIIGLEDLQRATVTKHFVQQSLGADLNEIIGLEDLQRARVTKHFVQQSLRALAVGSKRSTEIRCFFDGKLRKTFILENLSRSLNLQVVGEERVEVGVKKPRRVVCPRVKLRINNLKHIGLYVEIEALEVPNIMRDILGVHNPPKDDMTVSVVIGSYYYYKMFTGRAEIVDSDRIGVQTILGWVVDEDPNIPNRVMAHLLKFM